MLFQAEKIAKAYAPLVAKASPPSTTPQTDALLSFASNWFSIDLEKMHTDGRTVLAYLAQPTLWDSLAEIGIEAVELKGLKNDKAQVAFQIDSRFGTEQEYMELANAALKKGIHIIGKPLGEVTGKGPDFALALKNTGAYPELYTMVEVDPNDWNLLPEVKERSLGTNISWIIVQKLHKMGYVPTHFESYIKESSWNATAPILGNDQKTRRWIYLRDPKGSPYLDWLNPSFGALRLAAADSLYCLLRLGQPILELEELPQNTQETLILTIRKLGGFSAALTNGGVESLDGCTDVTYDHLTPMACLHALTSQDAETIRMIYNLLLEQNIQPHRLVHALEPFGRLPNDWAEFIHSPQKKHTYQKQEITGGELRKRLLREDIFRLKEEKKEGLSWKSVPPIYPKIILCETEKKNDQILALHLNLAKFFAFQPGVFSLSSEDLLGALPGQTTIDLLGKNSDCLYSCAPNQLINPYSFASQLKKILRVRKDLNLKNGKLIETVSTEKKGLLLLRLELSKERMTALLAVNFSQEPIVETLESYLYARKTAIDPLTGLSENKSYDSSFFELKIEPLTTKILVFQPKYTQKK
jgi:hypothetical protein